MLRFLAVLGFVCILFYSCGDSGTKPEVSGKTGLFENPESLKGVEISDPGQMHNEILTVFNRSHRLGTGHRMPTEELAKLIVESTNTVLASRHIDARMTERDFAHMLNAFRVLKEKGVFDIEHVTPESLFRLLDYSVEQGILERSAADKYGRAMLDIGKFSTSKQRDQALKRTCATEDPTRDAMFLDVLTHSYEFWTTTSNSVRAQSYCASEGDTNSPDPDPIKISSKWATYGTDALWTVIFILMIPPSTGASIAGAIASMTASISMEVLWNDWMDWLNSQLNPPED